MDKKSIEHLASEVTKIVVKHNVSGLPNMKQEDIVKVLGANAKTLTITKEVVSSTANKDKSVTETGAIVITHGEGKEAVSARIPAEGTIEFGPDFTVKGADGKALEAVAEEELIFRVATEKDIANKAELTANGCTFLNGKIGVPKRILDAISAEKKEEVKAEPAEKKSEVASKELVAEPVGVAETGKTEKAIADLKNKKNKKK